MNLFTLLGILNKLLEIINKWYDEHIRVKYTNEGRVLEQSEARTDVTNEIVQAKDISAHVDGMTDDEISKSIIDPR